tara:strand:+ start:3558 stop:7454 length:3897 start_codon:yes stop_codon:yes gene_type:complete
MSNYTDTTLLEANRKSSVEFLGGNFTSPNSWNNDLGSGFKLDIGDTISVESGYISEIGNEEATIEITGKKAINNKGETQRYTTQNISLVKVQGAENNQNDYNATTNPDASEDLSSKEGNFSWTFTEDDPTVNDIQDDEINMTHSYYKTSQGDNYISLPRRCSSDDIQGWYQSGVLWSQYNSIKNGSVEKANPYRIGTDYYDARYFGNKDNGWGYNLTNGALSTRTELANDGSKYTLFVRKEIKNYVPKGEKTNFALDGQRDPACMDYMWYKRTVKYKITNGFNSPANVATQFTNEMSNVREIENISYGVQNLAQPAEGQKKANNINLEAASNTFEPFPCATAWFINSAADLYYKNSYDNKVLIANTAAEGATPQDRGFQYDKYQNQFRIGATNPVSADPQVGKDIFEKKRLVPGYKFDRLMAEGGSVATNIALKAYTPGLRGAFVTSVRDTTSLLATPAGLPRSYWAASQEINEPPPGGDFPNDGDDLVQFRFTNEHLPSWYESSFATIGYKRPELQETGRSLMIDSEINTSNARTTIDGSFTAMTIAYPMTNAQANGSKSTIFTNLPWTDDNLLKLRNFFDRQKLYPELYDYDTMSASQKALINTIDPDTGVDNLGSNVNLNQMRWLHMNDVNDKQGIGVVTKPFVSWTSTYRGGYLTFADVSGLKIGMRLFSSEGDTSTPVIQRAFPADTYILSITGNQIETSSDYSGTLTAGDTISFCSSGLGNDNYYKVADAASPVTIRDTHAAGAVFVDFNPARVNEPGGFGNEPGVWESLSYGFAKKVFKGGKEFIGFSVRDQQFGTLPQIWFDNFSITEGRAMGFDKHFNAFGTAAIMLSNGYAGLWGGEYNTGTLKGDPYAITGNMAAADPYKGDPQVTPPAQQVLPDPKTAGKVFKSFQPQPNADGYFLYGPQDPAEPGPAGPIVDDNAPDFRFGPQQPCSPEWAILYNEIYCGANQPSLQFDSDSSRFSFLLLHTPELVGTDAATTDDAKVIADAAAPVYKLNKRLSRLNYTPNFIPYNNVFKIANASLSTSTTAAEKDQNITPFSIMDSQTGIFIEDYGCDEANWTQSLWELMGFTYEQFHRGGTRLTRMTDTGITTSTPTTNALVKTEDLSNFVTTGISNIPVVNTMEIGYPNWIFSNGSTVHPITGVGQKNPTVISQFHCPFPGHLSYPAISQNASSTAIIAENLPRKMISPIFLIKSDLLNPGYIGGREGTVSLPIIGIVDKQSGYGDFFFGAKDSTVFTNTIPRTIQNIKTAIVNADGREARVDDSCCIIYKIQKQIKSNSMVLENMLNPPKK